MNYPHALTLWKAITTSRRDHTWEGFLAHFWVRILAERTCGEIFFEREHVQNLRGATGHFGQGFDWTQEPRIQEGYQRHEVGKFPFLISI